MRAVYLEDTVIGFIVYCVTADENGNFWIPALMIDENDQGKGYGRAAMEKLVAYMTDSLNCKRLMIGHRPHNDIAARLYESLGFKKVSDDAIDGEIVRLLQLP
ncbi:spermidine acetyltransferase [Bacillus sp. FJAT-26390]|nr:spermidine acetyltransferase [Bacillus sp. FJAT-26390]